MNTLILASKSKGRIEMMENAGLEFEKIPADIDEATLMKDMLDDHKMPSDIALILAQNKAKKVSQDNPDALVIGSDQVLSFEGHLLSKAATKGEAIRRLKDMRGKVHHLISAVCVATKGEILWSTTERASLRMHIDIDDAFFETYKKRAGDALTNSVGGYWLEDIGSWLFKSIDGNYFTILGMPLLPLLEYLRNEHGITHG